MPYFVFRIDNHREYRCLECFDAYRDARDTVRSLRASGEGNPVVEFRLVFADSTAHGESLLRARRERTPSEDD